MVAKGAADKVAKEQAIRDLWRFACIRAGIIITCGVVFTCGYHSCADFFARLAASEEQVEPSLVRGDVQIVAGKFFLDISLSSHGIETSMNGRHLEKKGWNGVCVVPVPFDSTTRTCKVVALPVGIDDGIRINLRSCHQSSSAGLGWWSSIFGKALPECEIISATTVTMNSLLKIASAPKVIDYISMEQQDGAREIIQSFPFDQHCARSWSIWGPEDLDVAGIRDVLEVSQGCRITADSNQIWARCPCQKINIREEQSMPTTIGHNKHGQMASIEVLPSGGIA